MKGCRVTGRCWRSGRLTCGDRCSWLLAALFLLGTTLLGAAASVAQTCEDRNVPHAVALLGRLEGYCDRYDVPSTFDLYGLAAVAGEQAIPMLRKIAAWPAETGTGAYCRQWVGAARVALAKLGDEPYRKQLDEEFHNPKTRFLTLNEMAIVGDDQALRTLIQYLIEHANDPSMYHDFGDYGSDTREGLLQEIDMIRRRRKAPDLPAADYSAAGIAQWKEYLEKHKDEQLTFPVYPNVADAYLQCLARKVEWGYPDAILAIAAVGGDAALPILRQFPRPSKGEPMGFASGFGSLFEHGGTWRNIQGNTQVALAQLGDQEMLEQIVAELSDKTAYEAVRKLEFIGGKAAVDALVRSVDLTPEVAKRVQGLPTPNESFKPIWRAERYGVKGEIEQETCIPFSSHPYQECVMGVLSLMVKNPPLAAKAKLSKENMQTWKEWWGKNKDHAEFVVKAAPTFE